MVGDMDQSRGEMWHPRLAKLVDIIKINGGLVGLKPRPLGFRIQQLISMHMIRFPNEGTKEREEKMERDN